jgi:membrane protease YdiL (CAAX protease family)
VLVRYFLLVFMLAGPFLVIGATTGIFLLPGLPIAALMAICPGAAALLLVGAEHGRTASFRLLARSIDFARIRPVFLFLPVLLTCPAVALACYGWLRLSGSAVPKFDWDRDRTLALALAFFVAAVGEELGWSGYATVPLQRRMGPLFAGLVLGTIWALFHIPALLQAERSIEWIAGWALSTVATRVVLVWIFNITHESVAATALFHASQNLSWQLFPVNGSYFDYAKFGLMMALVAVVVVSFSQRNAAPPKE